jgi:hypothetical protein
MSGRSRTRCAGDAPSQTPLDLRRLQVRNAVSTRSNACTLLRVRWRPLSVRNDPKSFGAYDALHEGVPPWLRAGAVLWLKSALEQAGNFSDFTTMILVIEQSLQMELDWGGRETTAYQSLLNEVAKGGDRALDILDCALMVTSLSPLGGTVGTTLETRLSVGGSAWTVSEDSEGRSCLQRRVDEVVERAARGEMERKGNAAHHLHLSWDRLYGRNPDASSAYREAVRAVEAAAKPVVTPNDPLATLGKMIRAMRDKPSKWVTDLGAINVVADMMAELWTSQLDRHGTDDETVPLSVSPVQAEAAVHLAVTLVHWFRNGHVRVV